MCPCPVPRERPLTSLELQELSVAEDGVLTWVQSRGSTPAVLQDEGSAGDGCIAVMPPSIRGDSSSITSSFQTLIYCELGVLSK